MTIRTPRIQIGKNFTGMGASSIVLDKSKVIEVRRLEKAFRRTI